MKIMKKKLILAGESSSLITNQNTNNGMNDNAMADRMIGVISTQKQPVVQQQQPSMMMPMNLWQEHNGGWF